MDSNVCIIHGNALWSKNIKIKHELFDLRNCENSTNPSPRFIRKNKAHLFWLQILLQTLKSITAHHKKSASVSYNAKSQAILHLQLAFTYVYTFSVENFLTFFLPFYRVIKKVKARCIKQKSEGCGRASAEVLVPLVLEQKQLPLALCLRHLTLTGGEEEKEEEVDGRMGIIRGVHFHSSSPPNPVHESAETLCFGT